MTGKVNLFVVYISEAHAKNEWPLSVKFAINQHETLDERINAAQNYIDYFNVEYKDIIYVDSFYEENNNRNIEKVYSCWPERGYVFSPDGKIKYVGMACIEDLVRWPEEINKWLKENNI